MTTHYLPGSPCWLDLAVPDVDRAEAFYGAVFGWGLAGSTYDYHVCHLRGRAVCAVAEVCPVTPSGWTTYVATDDIARVVAAVVSEGGRVVAGPTAVPTGERATVADPAGRVLGLWRSDSLPGSQLFDEPGAPCWRAVARTIGTFFGSIFGHTSTVDERWPPHITVADVEETVSSVLRHGGTLVDGAQDTTIGRQAVVADPFGVPVTVIAAAGGPQS